MDLFLKGHKALITSSQLDFIMSTAASLDARQLDELVEKGLVPKGAIEALIEETTSEWVQVAPVLKEPPKVETLSTGATAITATAVKTRVSTDNGKLIQRFS